MGEISSFSRPTKTPGAETETDGRGKGRGETRGKGRGIGGQSGAEGRGEVASHTALTLVQSLLVLASHPSKETSYMGMFQTSELCQTSKFRVAADKIEAPIGHPATADDLMCVSTQLRTETTICVLFYRAHSTNTDSSIKAPP